MLAVWAGAATSGPGGAAIDALVCAAAMLVLFVWTRRTTPIGAAAAELAVFLVSRVFMFLVRAGRATAIRR